MPLYLGPSLSLLSQRSRTIDYGARYGVVSQWKFGSDGADSVGGNTLTLVNSPTFAAGKVGNAIQLASASSQYASIADNASLSIGVGIDFMISAWAFATTAENFGMVVAKGLSEEYRLSRSGTTNNVDFVIGGTSITSTGGLYTTGAWHHLCAWYDGTTAYLSIDGNTPVSGAATGLDTASVFQIGRRSDGFYHNGAIDAVHFCKSPPLGFAALGTEARDYFYNAGAATETLVA